MTTNITPSDSQAAVLAAVDAWLEDPSGPQWKYLAGYAGTGKCLGADTPVLMYDGETKKVQDVAVGDLIMGPDSQPRRVLGLGQGRSTMYRVQPIKGEAWTCNLDHILTLAGTNYYFGKTKDVTVREVLSWPDAKRRDWKLYRVGVEYPTATQPIDPYLIGLWLGDGTTACTNITSADSEILEYCRAIAPRYGLTCRITREKSKACRASLSAGPRGHAGENVLRTETRRCLNTRGEKFIPQHYLVADRTQRLALLAGLIDTDGHLGRGNGGYEIVTKSSPLRDGILALARSLGLAAYSARTTKTIRSTGFCGSYHRIWISGDIDQVPCLLPRKRARKRLKNKRVTVTGFELQPIGEGDYYGFTLDGDGRFLLGDFTVTHNTTIARLLALDWDVQYCAFTGKASQVLREKGCDNATTLHRVIYAPRETAVRAQDGTIAFKTEFVPRPSDEVDVAGCDVVVLDECSQVDTKMATDLLSYGKRVLVLGDPFQLPPVSGEGYFTAREPDWVLTEVHRQAAESGILRLATDVREGRGIGDPNAYGPEAAVISLDEAAAQEDQLLDWCEQVIVGTHRWRHHFNRRYRERAGFTSPYPMVGDQLVCLQNDHRRGLLNGSIWRCEAKAQETGHMRLDVLVRSTDDDTQVILADTWAHDFLGLEAELQKWPHRRRAECARFDYGYAITCHKSQGSEFKRVLLLDESSTFREHSARWLYTAITRASKQLVMVRR